MEANAGSRQARGTAPLALEHVWNWFSDLCGARTSNGFGLNPITFSEIAAWAQLTGNAPSSWEVSLLKRLDLAYLARQGKGAQAAAPEVEVESNDLTGVKTILSSLRAKANAVFAKEPASQSSAMPTA